MPAVNWVEEYLRLRNNPKTQLQAQSILDQHFDGKIPGVLLTNADFMMADYQSEHCLEVDQKFFMHYLTAKNIEGLFKNVNDNCLFNDIISSAKWGKLLIETLSSKDELLNRLYSVITNKKNNLYALKAILSTPEGAVLLKRAMTLSIRKPTKLDARWVKILMGHSNQTEFLRILMLSYCNRDTSRAVKRNLLTNLITIIAILDKDSGNVILKFMQAITENLSEVEFDQLIAKMIHHDILTTDGLKSILANENYSKRLITAMISKSSPIEKGLKLLLDTFAAMAKENVSAASKETFIKILNSEVMLAYNERSQMIKQLLIQNPEYWLAVIKPPYLYVGLLDLVTAPNTSSELSTSLKQSTEIEYLNECIAIIESMGNNIIPFIEIDNNESAMAVGIEGYLSPDKLPAHMLSYLQYQASMAYANYKDYWHDLTLDEKEELTYECACLNENIMLDALPANFKDFFIENNLKIDTRNPNLVDKLWLSLDLGQKACWLSSFIKSKEVAEDERQYKIGFNNSVIPNYFEFSRHFEHLDIMKTKRRYNPEQRALMFGLFAAQYGIENPVELACGIPPMFGETMEDGDRSEEEVAPDIIDMLRQDLNLITLNGFANHVGNSTEMIRIIKIYPDHDETSPVDYWSSLPLADRISWYRDFKTQHNNLLFHELKSGQKEFYLSFFTELNKQNRWCKMHLTDPESGWIILSGGSRRFVMQCYEQKRFIAHAQTADFDALPDEFKLFLIKETLFERMRLQLNFRPMSVKDCWQIFSPKQKAEYADFYFTKSLEHKPVYNFLKSTHLPGWDQLDADFLKFLTEYSAGLHPLFEHQYINQPQKLWTELNSGGKRFLKQLFEEKKLNLQATTSSASAHGFFSTQQTTSQPGRKVSVESLLATHDINNILIENFAKYVEDNSRLWRMNQNMLTLSDYWRNLNVDERKIWHDEFSGKKCNREPWDKLTEAQIEFFKKFVETDLPDAFQENERCDLSCPME